MFLVKPVAVSKEKDGVKFEFKVLNESDKKFFPDDKKVYVKTAQVVSSDGYGNFDIAIVLDDEPISAK